MINTEKITENSAAGYAAAFMLALTAGYVFSETQLAGIASFADISIAGALSLPYSAAVLTGSLVHSILGGNVGRNIVKISAMIMILITKLFFDTKKEPKFCGITTAVSIFLSGAAVSALIGEILYKLMFYAFYGSLSGLTAYSAVVIINAFRSRRALDLSASGGYAYAIVYTIIISALCSVRLPLVNAGITAGIAVTLLGAYYYGQTGGVLCGALTVCGAFLASPELGMDIVFLPAAAMFTGYFSKRGHIFTAAAFAGSEFVLLIVTGIKTDSFALMTNVLAGSAAFAAAVPFFSEKWIKNREGDISALPELMHTRMSFLSDSIGNVRTESERLAELLTKNAEASDPAEEASERLCNSCFRRLTCWKSNYDTTLRGFRKLSGSTEFSAETFPYELSECLHKEELCSLLEADKRARSTARLLEMRFMENRRLMLEQLRIMEEMIAAAGKRVNVRYSEKLSFQVSARLKKYGVCHRNAIAYYNDSDRLLIELYFAYQERPESYTRICDLISDDLRIPLSCSEPVCSGREIRVRLFEKPAYSLEVYTASLCAGDNSENGDSSLVFSDGTGVSYIVLSDGMGSGRKAAVESQIVVRMFRKLVSSGVNYKSALRMINSIMVTKSQEESFATFDALRLDLDTCGLTVIKSGAASTLIKHRGNVLKISSPTFPIGIYERTEVFCREYEFEEGDTAVMFSDGICENEYMYIKELLMSESSLKKIVDDICARSETFNPASHTDDVTVIGVRVRKS